VTNRTRVEQSIRDVIDTEMNAAVLSERLFSPGGLFGALATTEAERRALVQTPLFVDAQARFRALQRQEAAEFSRAVDQIDGRGRTPLVYKLERLRAS
jgi:hypothetical protein